MAENVFKKSFDFTEDFEDDKMLFEQVMENQIKSFDVEGTADKPKSISKKSVKHDMKTNFYFPSKLIIEAKIYCIKHRTNLTALMNELLEERLHGNKEGSRNGGKEEKKNAEKKRGGTTERRNRRTEYGSARRKENGRK